MRDTQSLPHLGEAFEGAHNKPQRGSPMSYTKRKNADFAKSLRKNMTRHERHLWYDFLAKYPVKFQRQKPIGSYVADFYCYEARLVIEVDGKSHYDYYGQQYDIVRTAVLEKYGLKILRIPNGALEGEFKDTCKLIDEAVKERLKELREHRTAPQ